MGRSLAERARPRWPQINCPYTLSDDEKRRLADIRDVYPVLEWADWRCVNRLRLVRWEFGKTKDL